MSPGRAAGVGTVLAILWAWLAVALLAPASLWVPGTEDTIQSASVHVVRGILLLAQGVLLRPFSAYVSDRLAARGTRHAPVLVATSVLLGLAWLALARWPGGALALVVLLSTTVLGAALPGATIAAGRRLGAMGLFAAGSMLAVTAAPPVLELMARASDGSLSRATALPLVVVVPLVGLAWPRGASTLLGSPPEPAPSRSRGFWWVALVFLFGSPDLSMVLEAHLHGLDEATATAFRDGWLWGGVAGTAIFLALGRVTTLRVLLPIAFVLAAAATFPIASAVSSGALLRAGLAYGATQGFADAAVTQLAMEASPPGREAWTFAMLRLVGVFGGSALIGPVVFSLWRDSITGLPIAASISRGLALVLLWFVPRELLGAATIWTWPKPRSSA